MSRSYSNKKRSPLYYVFSETSSSLTGNNGNLSHNLNNNNNYCQNPYIKPIQSTNSVPSEPSQNLSSLSSDNSNKSNSQQGNLKDSHFFFLTLLYQLREQNDNIIKIINKPAVEGNSALKVPVEIPMKNLDQLHKLETFLKIEGNLPQFVSIIF